MGRGDECGCGLGEGGLKEGAECTMVAPLCVTGCFNFVFSCRVLLHCLLLLHDQASPYQHSRESQTGLV